MLHAMSLPGMIACDACSTPALRVVGNTLVIEHRHRGEKHTSVIPMSIILDKIQSGPHNTSGM
jgi:hypothetical protein